MEALSKTNVIPESYQGGDESLSTTSAVRRVSSLPIPSVLSKIQEEHSLYSQSFPPRRLKRERHYFPAGDYTAIVSPRINSQGKEQIGKTVERPSCSEPSGTGVGVSDIAS